MIAFALSLILSTCEMGVSPSTELNQHDELPLKPAIENYQQVLNQVEIRRAELLSQYETADQEEELKILDSASNFIQEIFTKNIFPHWYGTEWDFNGHTNVPKQGEVACGYFVSTTLKHFGWQLNRYKFAQQASYYEVKTVCVDHKPRSYSNIDTDELRKSILEDFGEGLFIVGLDNHVGFLLVVSDKAFFIHSDYVSDEVKFELIQDSYAFNSNLYVVENISGNVDFVERWLRQQPISVCTP